MSSSPRPNPRRPDPLDEVLDHRTSQKRTTHYFALDHVKALPAVNAVYNGLIIRLKYAYMQWDYLHAAALPDLSAWARIGQIHTVMLEEEERF